MRTEDDLRAALTTLERHAPDAARVLPRAARARHARRSGSAWRPLARLRPAWRLAIALPLALAVAVGVTLAVLPSGQPQSGGQQTLTLQLLADRAAAAALASPAVSAGQWVYEVTETSRPILRPGRGHNPLCRPAG